MRFLAVVSAFLLVAVGASAAPITYIHTGFGSGTLGQTAFGALAPAAFTINATGDTLNITSCGGACLYNDNTSASITIDGLGSFGFLVGTRYFSNLGIVGFSRAGVGGSDLFNGPALAGWNMATSVGPIAGSASLLQWSYNDIQTTGGLLVFNSDASASTFTALVGDQPPAIPEPASLLLLGTGLALGGIRRLRQRR
jgi:hypothetical protein